MNPYFDEILDRRGTASSKWEKYAGQDVIPMWVADMDFPAPAEVTEALATRISHPIYGYTVVPDSLTSVTLNRFAERYHWSLTEGDLEWIPGIVPAINQAIRGLVRPGGAVVTATPVYHPFLQAPGHMGRQLMTLPMTADDDWQFPLRAFEQSAETYPEIDLLLLCHPMNPVGRTIDETMLAAIVEICVTHDIVIISDEIHSEIVFDGRMHTPLATLSERAAQQSLTFHAASKTFNLAGLGCAVVIAQNPHLMAGFKAAGAGIMANVNTLGYVATEAAWSSCEYWHQQLLAYLTDNRNFLVERVEAIQGVSMTPPEATYLAWLNIEALNIKDPEAFFRAAGVGLSPGSQFMGEGYVRLNFGCPRALLEQGLDRFETACLGRWQT